MSLQIIPIHSQSRGHQSWLANLKSTVKSAWKSCFDRDDFDCTVRDNALAVLGLTEEEAQIRDTLDERYTRLKQDIQNRISRARSSKPIVDRLTIIQQRVELSYKTLNPSGGVNGPSNSSGYQSF